MEQFKTISTFDLKGPIRIKALQAQLDEVFKIPAANPVVEKIVGVKMTKL